MMLDYRGRMAEATGANVFFVEDGEMHTPDARLLPERHHPADRDGAGEAARHRGDRARDMPEELKTADEIFLTGTAAEVTPVGQNRDLKFTPARSARP